MNIFDDLLEELREENLLEKKKEPTNRATSLTLPKNKLDISPCKLNSPKPKLIQNDSAINLREADRLEEFSELKNNISQFFDDEEIKEQPKSPSYLTNHIQNPSSEKPLKTIALSEEPLEPIALTKSSSLNVKTPDLTSNEIKFTESEYLDIEENQKINAEQNSQFDSIVDFTEDPLDNLAENATNIDNSGAVNPLLLAQEPQDSNFYLRRATEEVTSLQIVEHIISAIEREQVKSISKAYDDLPVKMALHDFQKVITDPNSEEHAQAEFNLMQETESWYSALSLRDKQILVGDVRRHCENAKPALSAHALIALARFYRNSPFTESVRSKFDMVITRLFTKELWNDKREFLFSRNELIEQINILYAEWSSIPLYETDKDDSDVLLGVLKFEDFISEVTNADTFEELIRNDFFNRLKIYKENTGEKFFAPLLLATIIESNVVVGNKYVELIQREKELRTAEELSEKYQNILDNSVSDATSKTLQLIEVLKEKTKPEEAEIEPEIQEELRFDKKIRPQPILAQTSSGFRINKFVLAFAILTCLTLGGLYAWVELFTPQSKTSASVRKVELENTPLKEYFTTARINKDTMYLVASPAWDELSNDFKEDLLKKTLAEGNEKGYIRILVLDREGKTISVASSVGIKSTL